MKLLGLWYGGTNYATPDPDRDLEVFASLTEAKTTYWRRQDFDPYYPCVENSELHLYRGAYTENGPDYVVTMGPRGGVVVSRG